MALAGRYTIIGDTLAKGSYGVVMAAWDDQASKMVAIKQQRADSVTAGRELNVFNALPAHKNVLAILDVFVSNSSPTQKDR
jgi:serine/threonine protein kinase